MHVVAMMTVITVEQPILLKKSEISKHVLLITHINKKYNKIMMDCNVILVPFNPLMMSDN
jgi:hypothetical protein